ARFPQLDQEQVRRRIIATADGAAGAGTGAGMVNPLLALTAVLPYERGGMPVVAEPPASPLPADAVAKVPPRDENAVGIAMAVGAGVMLAIMLTAAFALLIPQARRRRWRPGRMA
ncbi:hypothetical protein AB0J43_59830, partial [Nonomuraea fuscirosea]